MSIHFQPTEAIQVVPHKKMKDNETLFDTLTYHVDITIRSIQSLHNYYTRELGDSSLSVRTYSRTGAYSFSGFRTQENISTTIYLFLEGKPLKEQPQIRFKFDDILSD